ncbi:uncharacterized oxidoreductase MexAM1_META1p0182-like [Pieris napi]|uniref:uncharacterized oxidoreductase MexAM1_META1p0182-like n=1 Tax=Pieris napi TaxID=78633 RepID=UPI001FB888A6|nr:uncharacterized oxidoreductase MexAM1_META1p0182-like [Pieris napi]
MSFKNKVVIVTGASAGIGAAIAVAFAKEGASVVLVGRNEEKLKRVADECKAFGSTVLILKADVSNGADLAKIIPETIEKFGKLDVLVNNAGILRRCSLEAGSFVNAFEEILATNLRPIVTLTETATPHLIASKGNVVNISSVAGTKVLTSEYTAYSMLKAALNTFSRGAALELGKHGVRINSVSPGPVKTEIFALAGFNVPYEEIGIPTALNCWGEPEDIADLVLFIASDKAKSVTGSNYVADNGCLLY